MLPKYFSATKDRNTFEKHVPAPYIRKSFNIEKIDGEFILDISVVGIYDLYVNGYDVSLYVPANYKTKLVVPQGYKCSVNELKEGLNNFKYVKD